MTTTPKAPRLPSFGIRRNLLRPDGGERSDRVTYIELLFDLIFVLALTQLSRYLYENQSPTGALESAVLVLALWRVWVYATWVTNWLDPARFPVRAAVIGLALVGLIMSVSIFESFGDRGLTFAIAYVVLQIGRTVFMIAAVARHNRDLSHDFVRVLIWLAASGVFWILGGLVSTEFRIWFWLIALGIEYLSGAVGFRLPGRGSARMGLLNVWLILLNRAMTQLEAQRVPDSINRMLESGSSGRDSGTSIELSTMHNGGQMVQRAEMPLEIKVANRDFLLTKNGTQYSPRVINPEFPSGNATTQK